MNFRFSLLLLAMPFTASAALVVSEETQEALDRAYEVGSLMFEHDRAAYRVTDALAALGKLEDAKFQGWITEPTDEGIVVTFVGIHDDGRVLGHHRGVLHGVEMTVGAIESYEEPIELNTEQASRFRARQAAVAAEFVACSDSYNTVVLPNEQDGKATWLVYMVPASTDPEVTLIGGFHRFRVDAASGEILEQRAFTNSCLRVQSAENVEALTLTHLLDPIPTEVHVFIVHALQKPMYLMTTQNRRIWFIGDKDIQLVREGDAP